MKYSLRLALLKFILSFYVSLSTHLDTKINAEVFFWLFLPHGCCKVEWER